MVQNSVHFNIFNEDVPLLYMKLGAGFGSLKLILTLQGH